MKNRSVFFAIIFLVGFSFQMSGMDLRPFMGEGTPDVEEKIPEFKKNIIQMQEENLEPTLLLYSEEITDKKDSLLKDVVVQGDVPKPVKEVKILIDTDGAKKVGVFECNLKKFIAKSCLIKKMSYQPELLFKYMDDLKDKSKENFDISFFISAFYCFAIEDASRDQMPELLKRSKTGTAIMCRLYQPERDAGDCFESPAKESDGLHSLVRKNKYVSGRNLKLSKKGDGLHHSIDRKFLNAFAFPAEKLDTEKFYESNYKYNNFSKKEMRRLVKFLHPVFNQLVPKTKKRKKKRK